MLRLSDDYILVKKIEEPEKEGFKVMEVQDNFLYKGEVITLPGRPVYLSNDPVQLGDHVLFRKYSPDTEETVLDDGTKAKYVAVDDLLAVFIK